MGEENDEITIYIVFSFFFNLGRLWKFDTCHVYNVICVPLTMKVTVDIKIKNILLEPLLQPFMIEHFRC